MKPPLPNFDQATDNHARLAVSGILMDLLDYTPHRACELAAAASPDQRAAIMRAARWPIRSQARESVAFHASKICKPDVVLPPNGP